MRHLFPPYGNLSKSKETKTIVTRVCSSRIDIIKTPRVPTIEKKDNFSAICYRTKDYRIVYPLRSF